MFTSVRKTLPVSSVARVSIAGACAGLAVLTGCGSEAGEDAVVVGSGDDARGSVLAHIYAGAVRSTGVEVEVNENLGERSDYLSALDSGEVTLVPDLSGELLATAHETNGDSADIAL